jgi:hypothetical protein
MKVEINPHYKTKLGRIFNFIFLFIFIFQFNFAVNAQDKKDEMGDFFISNYGRAFLKTNYLNWSVLQDPDGVIYYGNSTNGVLTFDGQKVRPVLDNNGEPTRGNGRALLKDSKNRIYSIIGRSFGYIEKNKLNESIYFSLSDDLSSKDEVNSTLWSAGVLNDTIMFQSEKSVYLYKDKELLSIEHFENVLHTLNVNEGGAFLRIWGEGIYKLIDGKFKYLPSSKKIFAENRVDEQYSLDNGDQLLVSRNVGAWYLKKDGTLIKAKTKDIDDFMKKNEVYVGGSRLKDGTIPIATSKGGLIFINDKLKVKAILTKENGLDDNHTTGFIQDRQGDIWGTNFGLFRVSFDSTMTYFSERNNLSGAIQDIVRHNGKLYVRTSEDLYDLVPKNNAYEQSKFIANNVDELAGWKSILKFDDQIITTNNYSIKATKNRNTEIVSPIYRSDNTIRSELNPSIIFSSNRVYGLLAHQYKNGKWNQLKLKNQDSIKPLDITEVSPGKILTLTTDGVFIYDYKSDGQGEYIKLTMDKKFTKSDRLSLETYNESTHMLVDSLNNYYKLDLKNSKAIHTNIKIDTTVVPKKGFVRYVYNSDSKNGWTLSKKGLFKTHFDINKSFSFEQYPFYKVDISELAGGLYAEGSGKSEVLWIGSQDNKLYRYYPELAVKESNFKYKALVREIYTNGERAPIESSSFSFKNNNLSFEVAYPVFGNESKTLFSYWLEGQDNSWSEFVPDFKKEYTNLLEGDYKFRVRAKDASGEVSEEGFMEFTISPPWYRSIFAYVSYFLALIVSFIQFGKYQAKKSYNKAENERKNSELAAAKDLQNRLLPKSLPEIKNLDIAAFLRTSTEVGGDYYDFFESQDGSLYAICGDATGHGTPSGMLVSITKAGLIGLPQMSPKDMLHELNRVVKKVDLGILRMSLNIALIKDNKLTVSSAAMPPYYIYRANTNITEEIQIPGLPLGSFNDEHFDEITTPFNPGDILVILSDGLPEAPNLSGDLFDYQKLQDLISTYGNKTANEIIDNLISEADEWLAGENNPDDITLVVIKHN